MTRWLSLFLAFVAAAPVWASPQSALASALADARTLGPAAIRTRYLDLSPVPADYRAEVCKVLAFHVNQLSRESYLVPPRRVNETLLAVVLDDYRWDTKTLEKFAGFEVYFTVPVEKVFLWPGGVWRGDGRNYAAGSFKAKEVVGGVATDGRYDPKQMAELVTLTQSTVPLVRADWFLAQTSRQINLNNVETGAAYYDFLGLRSRADVEKLARLNVKDSLELGKEMRAAIERSGISIQNRQVVRFQALTGPVWFTLDTDSNVGKKNALRNLARNDFQHLFEEIYFYLPNGLYGYFLSDDKGVKANTAPDAVGPNDAPLRIGRDSRIHPCVSCLSCHLEGLRPIDDWVRRTLRQPLALQAVDYQKFLELRRAYFSNLEKQLDADRLVFADTVKELTGWTVAENSKAFLKFYDWYVHRMRGPAEIADEMGVPEERLLAALKAYAAKTGYVDLPLSGLLQNPPVPLRVEHLEELQPLLWQIVGAAK